MTITSISGLPIEIIQKIINLIDDRDILLALATNTQFKDPIYKRLFPKLNIFHKYIDVYEEVFSYYFTSKFLNFLDDYDNYVPNEILTNIDTLFELFEIKHINFKNTKIDLFIHPYHTMDDLRFSIENFKINSIMLRSDYDFQLARKSNYRNNPYFAQLKNEEFRKLTLPNTLEKFEIGYDNIFLRNLPESLREVKLIKIKNLDAIKLPLSLKSLYLSHCEISGVMLDLSYLHQLKDFDSYGRIQIGNDLSSGKLKFPSSVKSICLHSSDFQSLNNLSDYKNLKILKLKRCKGSILLFNTILPPNLEYLSIEFDREESVNLDNGDYGETRNLNNVSTIHRPGADLLYDISGEDIFPSTLKILKLTSMKNIILDFQLNLPNLEVLKFAFSPFINPSNLINENLINLKKLTVKFCNSSMTLVKLPKNLEYLNLENNNIRSLTQFNFKNLNKLRHLIVSSNKITRITEQIAPNLKILDISYNPIKKLHHQENLEQLFVTTSTNADDIYINNLRSCELNIKNSLSLNTVYKFDSCYYLKELILRVEVVNISNLTFPDTIEILDIDCDRNDTKNIEHDLQKGLYNISNCYNLKTFKLRKCNIEHFNFNNLPQTLENFSIIYSKLKTIDGSSKNLINLKSLNLEYNRIDNNGIKNCLFSSSKIETINLSKNDISDIDCIRIESCPRLIELNLEMNSNLYITDEFDEKLKLTCPRLSVIRGHKETNKKRHIDYVSAY
ncbi:uncharacterized protein KGF55_000076 [Candida pseudojiufengensis]|uniref:uncharacterized protein n=1 Tax=Candida pseudojiufengensis TaxID=497109 RepID=UPI0022242EFE|nr:uncharacterized protein KGF55_000076 [Candida pseudojiufengensis]KAI5967805.1 hypothetical protein KGF55_000076 [Candida pseudojiufengensis]